MPIVQESPGHQRVSSRKYGCFTKEGPEGTMPRLIQRIAQFSRTPQGRRMIASARRAASDPRKRAQARQLLGRLRGRR